MGSGGFEIGMAPQEVALKDGYSASAESIFYFAQCVVKALYEIIAIERRNILAVDANRLHFIRRHVCDDDERAGVPFGLELSGGGPWIDAFFAGTIRVVAATGLGIIGR